MDSRPEPLDALPFLVLHEFEPNQHESVRQTSVKHKADLWGLVWPGRRQLEGSCAYDLALDQRKDAVGSLVEGHGPILSGGHTKQV